MSYLLKKLHDKVVVITGANGYIGSALTKELTNYTSNVIRVTRRKVDPCVGVEDWVLDLEKGSSWDKIVNRADIIFHLACNTSIQFAENNVYESLTSNLLPIINLIEASDRLEVIPRVVYASTATVYGMTTLLPVSESLTPSPVSVYDLHKIFVEQQLSMASHANVINATSLRLSNVFGPSENESSTKDRGVLNKITKMVLKGDCVNIYGDGNYIRDYIYIDDVVSAFLQTSISSNISGKSLNVSSGIGHTVVEVFEMIVNAASRITGKKVDINYIPWSIDTNEIEHRNFVGNNDLLRHNTKWTPTVSVEQGIDMILSYYDDKITI